MKYLIGILLFYSSLCFSMSFEWILDKDITDSNKFAHNPKARATLKIVVPKAIINKKYKITLEDEVWKSLVFPGSKKIIDKRYITIEGARVHSVTDKAFLWLDIKNNTGAFVINHCPFESKLKYSCYLLGSATFKKSELPKEFLGLAKKWMKTYSILKVIDKEGKSEKFSF